MKDAPAFDFYPERWLSGVAMFSDAEQLSYIRLLCHQWINNGLPDDVATLKRVAGKGVTEAILAKFPTQEDGMRRNLRLEEIRNEQRNRIESRRIGAAITHAKTNGIESLNTEEKEMLEKHGKLVNGRLITKKSPASNPASTPASNPASNSSSNSAPTLASGLPPPTTHHPPQVIEEREYAQGREETASGPEPSPLPPSFPSQALAIASAYVRRDAPMEVLQCISDAIGTGSDPATILAKVKRCAQFINSAPGGSTNRYVPSARRFFGDRQWESPEAFEGRWKNESKPLGKLELMRAAECQEPPRKLKILNP